MLILNHTIEKFDMSLTSIFSREKQCRAVLQVKIQLRICLSVPRLTSISIGLI
jgi:hypothetical protein